MNLKLRYISILLTIFLPLYFFRLYQKTKVPFKIGDKVKITSSFTEEPQIYQGKQHFKIKNIKVSSGLEPELHYGDEVQVIGRVSREQNKYYLQNPKVTLLKSNKNLKTGLFKLRQNLEQKITQVLPEPQASLLSGIVLGVQKTLPQDFYQNLIKSGTLHIVVASGMNISLVAGGLKEVLAHIFSRKPALIISLIIIYLYCLLAGSTPAIIRASLMAGALYLSYFFGRQSTSWWTLILTACLMLIVNPLIISDTGFQLSFSATFGLITFTPKIQKKLSSRLFLKKINQPLSETLGALIFTSPILIFTFGRFNPLIIIPNIFIIELIEYIMYLGLIISFSSLIFLPLTQLIAFFAWLPLTYLILVINFFGPIL